MFTDKVLIACATYAGKRYAFNRWVRAARALKYDQSRISVYVVDNTRQDWSGDLDDWYRRLSESGIQWNYIEPVNDFDETYYHCWRSINEQAQHLGVDWIFSVEADNIVPHESLEMMVDIASSFDLDLVTMPYRPRAGITTKLKWFSEMGCMLISRRLLDLSLERWCLYANMPTAIFRTANESDPPYGFARLHPDLFHVQHLEAHDEEFTNCGLTKNLTLVTQSIGSNRDE